MIRRSRLLTAALSAVASVAVVAPAPAFANHSGPSSPVVGYIQIVDNGTGPTYALFGALANNTLWNCSASGGPFVAYTVTCTPTPLAAVNLVWHCDVLHADVHGLLPTSRARTSLDCDGNTSAWEAQTALVAQQYDFAWAASNVTVTQFVCRVDGGNNFPAPTPTYRAGCGDPGVVRLH